ncbi:MAG: tetratricopeptide repeat protein, partial [Actinomycetota bacterium]
MCQSRRIESLDIDDARELVIGADDDPASVREMAAAALAHLDDSDVLDEAEAIVAWALGLALRHLRELDAARSWLDRALSALAPGSDDHTQVTLTLTGTMAYLGELAEAEQRLRDAEPSAALAGRVTFQLAAVTERVGRVDEAAAGYHDALAQFRRSGDRLGEAHALSGIGLVELESDQPSAARTSFGAALEIYRELDLEMLIATGTHNVGLAAMRSGDLVRASELLGESARELDRLGQPFAETALDHVESLLLLGRPDEAAERATRALESIQSSSASTDRAEMLTALGLALARGGAHDVAQRAFATADQLFLDQDRGPWRSVVNLRRLQSEAAPDRSTLESLLTLSTALRSTGMETAAIDSDAAAVDIADRLGAVHLVEGAVTRLLELDVDDPRRLHAEALRALVEGDLQSARRSARSALSAVTGRLGEPLTLDLKSALLAQRDGVIRVGLETARHLDDPSMVVELVLATQHASSFDPETADRRWRNANELIAVADDGARLALVRSCDDRAEFLDAPDRGAVVEALAHHAFLLSDTIIRPPGPDDAGRLDRSAAAIRTLAPWLEGPSEEPLLLVVSGDLARAPWTSVSTRSIRLVTSTHVQDP